MILGVWNIVNSSEEGAQTYRVRSVTVHPYYSRRTLQNDIALMKLSRKIEFSRNIRPVCLPEASKFVFKFLLLINMKKFSLKLYSFINLMLVS